MGNESFVEIMRSTNKLLGEYYMAQQRGQAESFAHEDIDFAVFLSEHFCWVLKCIGDRMLGGKS